MLNRVTLQESAKLAIALTIFYAIALWANWNLPKYGALAIAVISLGATGASLHKGILRIVGTTAGLTVGLAVVAILSQRCWANLAFLSAYFIVVGYAMQGSRYAYAWFVTGILPAIVWASSYGKAESAFDYASFRYLETATGVAIYTIVSMVFWRRTSGQALDKLSGQILGDIHALFGFYREGLDVGKIPDEAAPSRKRALGSLAKLTPTLDGAYTDTPSVIEKKHAWERMPIELRGALDALELWRECFTAAPDHDFDESLPDIAAALGKLEQRFARIDEIWKARTTNDAPAEPGDHDGDLLTPIVLVPGSEASGKSGVFEHATVLGFVERIEDLDTASRKLLLTLRDIVGLEAVTTPAGPEPNDSPARESRLDAVRLRNAVFPACCFALGYVLWILTDPPPGAMVPAMAGVFGLLVLMAHANAAKLLVSFLGCLVFAVAPVYLFVMPRLATGAELLTLIFVFTFAIGVLLSKAPMIRTLAIVLFVVLTGISNDQAYSLLGVLNGGLLFALSLGIVAIVQTLVSPIRPERELLRDLRCFFRGCARITHDLGRSTAGPDHARREQVFRSMLLPTARRIPMSIARLDPKEVRGLDKNHMSAMVDAVHSVTARMRTLELSRHRVGATGSPALTAMAVSLREAVQPRFEAWARFEAADELDESDALQGLTHALEQKLEDEDGNGDDTLLKQIHGVLDVSRGLLRSVVAAQDAFRQVDWDSLAEARF